MDPEIISWAYKLKSLIDGKHQFARAIDASTRQLIQLVIGQSKPPADTKEPPYAPTKEAFQADLLTFAHAIFRQLSKPPPPIDEAVARTFKSSTAIIERTLAAHTKALETFIIGQSTKLMAHTTRAVEPLNRVAIVVENIDKN